MDAIAKREAEIFENYYHALAVKIDRLFACVFAFQWCLAIVFAFFISPQTWIGNTSQVHLHVYAAIFLGGVIAALPIGMVLYKPGTAINRYVIAVAQMLFSTLLIHLSGGRIETHFHVFGSLAFLAFYRDFRPLLVATIMTAADHLLRGLYWPESVYGVLTAVPLRALEHTAWVVFEDIFLLISMKNGHDELKAIAKHQTQVESTLANVEQLVQTRTSELFTSQQKILEQQQSLVATSKMSALGEMAGGVAHEINTPLTVISMRIEFMEEALISGKTETIDFMKSIVAIKQTTQRIAKIVQGLRSFARDGSQAPMTSTLVSQLIDDTLSFCNQKFSSHGVVIEVIRNADFEKLEIECRTIELSQVLLNLLNNAYDAIENCSEKWIQIGVCENNDNVEISVTDAGTGLPKEIQDKLMQPFFTTKEIGKGTGLGLSISKGIINSHNGQLFLDTKCANTKFTISLPKRSVESSSQSSAA